MLARLTILCSAMLVACSSRAGSRSCPAPTDTGVPLSAFAEHSPGDDGALACVKRGPCRWRLRDGVAVRDVDPPNDLCGLVTAAQVGRGIMVAWNDGEWGSGLTLTAPGAETQDLSAKLTDDESVFRDGHPVRDSPIAVVQHGNNDVWIVALRYMDRPRAADPWVGGKGVSSLEPDTVVWEATIRDGGFAGRVTTHLTGEGLAAGPDGDDALFVVRRKALDRIDAGGTTHVHRFADPLQMSDAGAPVRREGGILIPVRFGFVRVAVAPSGKSLETWLLPPGCDQIAR